MDSENPAKLDPKARWAIALACLAAGIFPILAAFDIGPLNRSDIHGPPWIGVVAGAIFCMGGLSILLAGGQRFGGVIPLLGILIVAGFAALGNWVAFGAGSRTDCSGGFSMAFFSSSGAASEIECRVAFGIGAVMLDGMLLWGLGHTLVKAYGARAPFTWVEKAGKGLLVLTMMPFILLMAAFALASSVIAALREWRSTGRWPRNEAFRLRKRTKKPDVPS